jgi:predicted 2-oxoglutarate/Fe(II)-dependent dioxygenase YbiX
MKEWIGYYEDILTNELSENLALNSKGWKQSTFTNEKGLVKNSLERVVMDETHIRENMEYWAELLFSTTEVIKLYQKKHSYMKWFKPNRTTDFRINKYSEGGFMSEHADNIHHSHGQEYGYPSASLLFFLNDGYEGGELVIADNVYTPKRNSAIIFPSNFMFPHHVNKITKGTRYSMITWLM